MLQGGVFAGQFGVITGGGSGIGRAIALGFAAHGGTPCLVGRDAAKLREVADQVRTNAPRVSIRPCDLSRIDEVASLVASIEELGRVDLLVHSAGAWEAASLDGTSSETLDRLYAINVRAPLETAQGQVVFVSSSAALRPSPDLVAYGATKRAMTGVAEHVRQEVNSRGVRVLTVYPGRTATPMQERVFRHEGQTYDATRLLRPEDVATIVLQALALPGSAEVTDIHIRPMKPIR